jgi:toxin FitB
MSGFLLDTNVVSETVRLRPEPRVTDWIARQPNDALFLSVLTLGELRRGFITAPDPQRRARLERWLETDVLRWFEGRILPVTREIADHWGVIDGTCQLRGTKANTADGLIAATALEHGLTVVTRNVKDFALFSVSLFNPWEKPPQHVTDPRLTP